MKLHRIRSRMAWLVFSFIFGLPSWTLSAQDEVPGEFVDIVEAFVSAYEAEELDMISGLGDENSRRFASSIRRMRRSFERSDVQMSVVSMSHFEMDGDEATLRVAMQIASTEEGEAEPHEERVFQTFDFRKSNGSWSIWEYSEVRPNVLIVSQLQARIIKGETHLASGQLQEARPIIERALTDSIDAGYRTGIAMAQGDLGQLCYLESDFRQALVHLEAAKIEFHGLRNLPALANQWIMIGSVQQKLSDLDASLASYRKARQLAVEANVQVLVYTADMNIANTLGEQGKLVDAINLMLETKRNIGELNLISRQMFTLGGRGEIDLNLAFAYCLMGRAEDALAIAEKRLEVAEETENELETIRCLMLIGVVDLNSGRLDAAKERFEESLVIVERLGQKELHAATVGNLALVEYTRGNYADGLALLHQSRDLYAEIGQPMGVARQKLLIGALHERQGDYQQALNEYDETLQIAEQLGSTAILSGTLLNKANVYLSLDNPARAAELCKESLEIADRHGYLSIQVLTKISLATSYSMLEQPGIAVEVLEDALAICKSSKQLQLEAQVYSQLASAHSVIGNHEIALQFAPRADTLAREMSVPEVASTATVALAQAQHDLGNDQAAKECLIEAVELIERSRLQVAGEDREQQQYFERKLDPYHKLVELLVERSEFEEALVYSDRVKARALGDQVRGRETRLTRSLSLEESQTEAELLGKLRGLNRRLLNEHTATDRDEELVVKLRSEVDQARLSYLDFESKLFVAHPELRLERASISPIAVDDALGLLPNQKSALVDFLVCEEQTFAFVITPEARLSVHVIPIAEEELTELVEALSDQIQSRSGDFYASSRGLYDLLCGPFSDQLKECTNLTIVPDGPLWDLPFAALSPTPNRYLIEQAEICLVPSLSVARDMRAIQGEADASVERTLLAMGNPQLSTEGVSEQSDVAHLVQRLREVSGSATALASLPEAENEVKAIAQIYGQQSSRLHVGNDATEGQLKQDITSSRVIHLATHAVLDGSNPLYSFVLLSPGEESSGEDGLLEAWEIMKLDLNLELVVLSACETAGTARPGEGLVGLSWAFFIAGCPTTVSSLWKVEDHATRNLMVEFHEHLTLAKEGDANTSKTRALQLAQLSMIRGYNPQAQRLRDLKLENLDEPVPSEREDQPLHPFYWAGFVLVGDSR